MPPTERHGESDVAIVAFLGPTGSGLSSFIDRAAGKEPGKNSGHTLASHTKNIRATKVLHPTSHLPYILVDTPGFADGKSDDAVLKLTKWLKDTYSAQAKLSGIIYLHRISDNRMTYSPATSLGKLKGLCRQEFGSRIVLATTMWSKVPRETATLRKSDLEQQKWKSMIDQGSEVIEFKDTTASAWEIIDRVVGQFSAGPRSVPGITLTAPGMKKSRSLGALLARKELYREENEGHVRHQSDLSLVKEKKPWGERFVGWFKGSK